MEKGGTSCVKTFSCRYTENSCPQRIASDRGPDASPAVEIRVAEGLSEMISRGDGRANQGEKTGSVSTDWISCSCYCCWCCYFIGEGKYHISTRYSWHV